MNGYELSRKWHDFSFENKECKCIHAGLFYWIVELNNRLGWKEEFGLPSHDTMEGLSIGNKNTYYSALRDLQKWGFIEIVSEAKNQFQSCKIKICRVKSEPAIDTALDTALIQHCTQHCSSTVHSTVHSIAPIDKQINKETNKQINKETMRKNFDTFWSIFPVKKGKAEAEKKFMKLSPELFPKIISSLKAQKEACRDFQFFPHPTTWVNQKRWEDEIEIEKTEDEEEKILKEQGELKFRHYCIKKIGGEQAWENYFSGKTCWNSEELEETQKYFWSVVLPFRDRK